MENRIVQYQDDITSYSIITNVQMWHYILLCITNGML